MKKNVLWLVSLVLMVSMFLAACSGSDDTSGDTDKDTDAKKEVKNEITYGFTSPFKGVFSQAFYGGVDDAEVMQFTHESLVKTTADLEFVPHLAEKWEYNEDFTKLTFTLKKGIKWHDGHELTMEDFEYALYIIADPEYTGSRFSNVEMVKGAKEYKEGTVDTIEGIKVIDDYTLEITVETPQNNLVSNLWTNPEPKHYYEGLAVTDIENSEQVRQAPIGTGPFKIKTIVPGETVELVRNEDYWGGDVKLDRIVYKVVDGALVSGLIENGEIDVVGVPMDQWSTVKEFDNINAISIPALSYSYIGLKLGHWDAANNTVVQDNEKLDNKNLRKAMLHAIDREGYIENFRSGLGAPLNVPFPSASWAKIDDSEITDYNYDVEKAKALLAEAGYKDVNGDGFVEGLDGKEFTLNFDYQSGSDTSETRAEFFIQSWQAIGLNVKLNGGLKEFNTFYEFVENDDPSVEVFAGAWSLGTEPDPAGLWLSTDFWNFPRWNNPTSDELIKKAQGFPEDPSKDIQEYRTEIYHEWQKLVNEELPLLFLEQYEDAWAINKRVQGVEVTAYGLLTGEFHNWSVTK